MWASVILGCMAIGGIVYMEREALRRGINGRQLRVACVLVACIGGMSVNEVIHLIGG